MYLATLFNILKVINSSKNKNKIKYKKGCYEYKSPNDRSKLSALVTWCIRPRNASELPKRSSYLKLIFIKKYILNQSQNKKKIFLRKIKQVHV